MLLSNSMPMHTKGGVKPLYIRCGYPSRSLVKIITLYEPDPALWTDFRGRRNDA